MPKLPKLKTKTVGILVIAAVVLIVLATQMSTEGFKSVMPSPSPSDVASQALRRAKMELEEAEMLLNRARTALQQAQTTATTAADVVNVKRNAVAVAEKAYQAAINVPIQIPVGPTMTPCPPPGNQIWVPPFQSCPPCYSNMGSDWTRGGQFRCQVL